MVEQKHFTQDEIYIPNEEDWNTKFFHKWARRYFREYPRILETVLDIGPKKSPSVDYRNGEGVFLYGDLGAGKTITAARMILDFQKQLYLNRDEANKTVLFTKTPKLLHRIKNTYNKDSGIQETEASIIKAHQTADFLVLDEFGMSKTSEWLLELLYLIVDHRYDSKLPTVFTSNYNLDQIAEILGDERISSRIQRSCRVIRKKPWDM